MKRIFNYVMLLFVMPTLLAASLSAQEAIWQSDPDYFESFSSDQLEEWTDLLLSLKSAKLNWPANVEALKAFPWIDYVWIETTLLPSTYEQLPFLLTSVYANEATKETIHWIYSIGPISKQKSKKLGVSFWKKSPDLLFISSSRSELNAVTSTTFVQPDFQQRISFSSQNFEAHIISTQAGFHEYSRWKNPSLLGGYIRFSNKTHVTDKSLIFGRVRAKFGTGLIGQSVPFLMLTATGSFLKPSSTFTGSLNRSSQQSILGGGLTIKKKNIHLSLISGLQNVSLKNAGDTYEYAIISRTSEWSNTVLSPSKNIPTHLVHLNYQPSQYLSISLQSQYVHFKKLQYNDAVLKPRVDYELGITTVTDKNTSVSAHFAQYASRSQFLINTVKETAYFRLSYYVGFWEQPANDPFRRVPILIGSTGKQKLYMLKGQFLKRQRNGPSFLVAFIDKSNAFEMATSTKRWLTEIRFPWKNSQNLKQLFNFRFQKQVDTEFDGQRVLVDRLQLSWMLDTKMTKDVFFQFRAGMNTSTDPIRFTKPSLFLSNHFKWTIELFDIGFRINEMIVSEQNAMQRLDAWSMGNQLRDVIVRNQSSTAYQIYGSLNLEKKTKLLVYFTRQLNQRPKAALNQDNENVLIDAKQWINVEIRVNL